MRLLQSTHTSPCSTTTPLGNTLHDQTSGPYYGDGTKVSHPNIITYSGCVREVPWVTGFVSLVPIQSIAELGLNHATSRTFYAHAQDTTIY